MPKLYNRHHEWPDGAIFVGRPTPWGNPFVLSIDGTRDEVCDKYAALVERSPALRAAIKKHLKGKDLVCVCAPKRCHGDYLLRIANED